MSSDPIYKERSMARWISVLLLLCACLALPMQAGPVVAKPEDVGLSSERLARVHEAVQRHIDAKAISGAVTLVARNGRVAHLEAHGFLDIESKRPMPKDGIFRLASMSKPITAAAVMMLLEEGKVRLSDPVWRFIPEFKGAKVAVAKGGVRSSGRCRSTFSPARCGDTAGSPASTC
jgi:CubicO group peptidase (beta-lactamase class C family)